MKAGFGLTARDEADAVCVEGVGRGGAPEPKPKVSKSQLRKLILPSPLPFEDTHFHDDRCEIRRTLTRAGRSRFGRLGLNRGGAIAQRPLRQIVLRNNLPNSMLLIFQNPNIR